MMIYNRKYDRIEKYIYTRIKVMQYNITQHNVRETS